MVALLATLDEQMKECPAKDIGIVEAFGPTYRWKELTSSYDDIFQQILAKIGNELLIRRDLRFAPSSIVDRAINKELSQKLEEAYQVVSQSATSKEVNIIDSHFNFRFKVAEIEKRKSKARLCTHGNRDQVKETIRNDAVAARSDVIGLMLSVATIVDVIIGCLDIKGAFLQSGPINQELYVRSPRDLGLDQSIHWLLEKVLYGIVEVERQWAKTLVRCMLVETGVERISRIFQLFIGCDDKDEIVLMIAKSTDDTLMAGRLPEMEAFVEKVCRQFRTCNIIIGAEVLLNGCRIIQDQDDNITVDMNEYIKQIGRIDLTDDWMAYKKRLRDRSESRVLQEAGQRDGVDSLRCSTSRSRHRIGDTAEGSIFYSEGFDGGE